MRAPAPAAPDNAAHASASGQLVRGATGFFGGGLPRAAYQAVSASLRTAMPAGIAKPAPRSFHDSGAFTFCFFATR